MASEPCPLEFITFAEQLADRSRALVLKHFRSDLAIEQKGDLSPVTLADRETEAVLREAIEASHPDHGIIGEEFENCRTNADCVWVLDPIDGTKSFITGSPMFGTLIALVRDGRPVLGVIDMPALGERWVGAAGFPTRYHDWRGTRSVSTRPCAALDRAYLRSMTPDTFLGDSRRDGFLGLVDQAHLTLYGGDCYSFGQIASGTIDMVVENDLGVHDFVALVPVVEGAGGVVVDCSGQPLTLESPGDILALGDKSLLQPALTLLNA